MRRELKLLLIEMNVLRVEVEQLRAMEREARNTEEFLSASVSRLMESRDQWRGEAERLHALIAEPAPEQMGWPYRVFSHPIRFALSVALGFSAFSFCP